MLRDTQSFETQNDYRRWLAEGYYAAPEVVDIDDGWRTVFLVRATG